MEKLIEVIKKIANKYIDKVNLVIKKNSLTLEYFVYKNGKRYLYKTMQINEDKDKLKVIIFPEKIRKEVDIAGLEDIILILDKQSQFIEYTKKEIENIKIKYPKETRIKLIKQYDLQAVDSGTIGSVEYVDDAGQIHIKWDNGRTLALIHQIDEFEILCPICKNSLKDKTHIVYKVGEVRAFAYGNEIYFGKIISIDKENHIYKLEEIKTKNVYRVSQEYVLLGCD